MHETAQKIISLFRNNNLELSTSDILSKINKEYINLKNSNDPESKRKIAQLHRKILYHLNRLVDFGILSVIKHGEKGEKFFNLNIKEGEEISEISPKYKKRIIISRPVLLSMPIEGYEQKGLVLKYEPATWIDRLNSVIIFCDKLNTKDLYEIILENIFPVINDTISLENFGFLINSQNVSDFLKKINSECEDYGKNISITINLSDIKNKENFLTLLNTISENRLDCINFIFSLYPKDMEEYFSLVSEIIETYLKIKKTLYIKNRAIQNSPYFIGKAGPYCFIDREWQFSSELVKNVACLACSQSSIIVDVNRFYNEYGLDAEKFSQLILNISKSLLSANSLQRRKSGEYFKDIIKINKNYEADFFNLSRNYIRFWNFGLAQPNINQEFVLNMINEAKKKIDKFTAAEETIYKSCGMTTRFKIALSCKGEIPSSDILSPPKYLPIEISDFDDLYKKDIKEELLSREVICDLFDGGNEVTFYYKGMPDIENIARQISVILSNYKLPLINYNFKKIKGDLKLTSFLKWK